MAASRTVGRLVRNVTVALFVPGVVVWLFLTTFFPFTEAQRAAFTVFVAIAVFGAGGGWSLVVARLVRPIARAVEAKQRGALALPDARHEAKRGQRLPLTSALFLTGIWIVGIAAIAPAMVARGVAEDLAVAGALVGLASGCMAGLLQYYVMAAELMPAVEELGGAAEARQRTTVRGKILAICFAGLFLAVVLVGATSYARYRGDTEEAWLASVERAQGAMLAAGKVDAAGAQFVFAATGAPTLALVKGRVAGSAGPVSLADFGSAATAGRARARSGEAWEVKSGGDGARFASWLADEPLRRRREEFWHALVVFALSVFAVAGFVIWAAARTITQPMAVLGRAAGQIAGGDLTAIAPSITRDEVGQLSAAFTRMASGLKTLASDVKSASEGVTESARGTADIGARVRDGAEAQRQGVDAVSAAVAAMRESIGLVGRDVTGLSEYVASTSAAVGEMAAALEEVQRQEVELERAMAQATAEVAQLADAGAKAKTALRQLEGLADHAGGTLQAVNASLSGLEAAAAESEQTAIEVDGTAGRAAQVVAETQAGIERVRGTVADAQRRVTSLGRRSEDITQIVDFIADVAGRTNLLSLNASIIAAQAGEHGKAFAVVADQIRELAAQIASSTKSIGEIIAAVRGDVDGTADLIGKGDAAAAEGVRLARNSGEALGQIRRATAQARETASAIQAAVQAHVASSREISDLVTQVAAGSKTVEQAMELVNRSASAVGGVGQSIAGMAEKMGRALEEQAGVGRQQLESLERINAIVADVNRAVRSHDDHTERVRASLEHLAHTAGQHEVAVEELSGLAERLQGRAKALAERVGRFKV